MSDIKRIKKNIISDVITYKAMIKRNYNRIKKANRNTRRSMSEKELQQAATAQLHGSLDRSEDFNAAKYLFVSSRLARMFPDLSESYIVANFSTKVSIVQEFSFFWESINFSLINLIFYF